MNLNQVPLPSTDVGRAVEFSRQLGFIQVVDNLPTHARFECPERGATSSIHRVPNVAHDSGVVVYFERSYLDAVVTRLQARGVTFDSQPKDLFLPRREESPKSTAAIVWSAIGRGSGEVDVEDAIDLQLHRAETGLRTRTAILCGLALSLTASREHRIDSDRLAMRSLGIFC